MLEKSMRTPLLGSAWLLVLLGAPAAAEPPLPEKVEFNRDIRPILSEHCFACHGPDDKKRKADLRLDVREGAVGPEGVIVPGKSGESELFARITEEIPRLRMPPEKARKPLKPGQVALIKRWIDQGAEYQGHWAFIPPVRPDRPEVKDPAWVGNPIDRFVLARLEREGLRPAPEADRVTLIRRVTFDLTGMPPTPAEVRAFVEDRSPDAYEKVVDRLLASPRFGEHRARYWLDVVRYGDTHGLHLDNYREMWAYRDWVVAAYNANKPFDEFTVEQLAGDLLPEPTRDQLVASGYNRAHVTTNEGGSIAEEVYVRNVVDRVATTSTVWMGLTAGCAVCHDHKYDPIKQKEFYQLFAFFNSLDGDEMDGNKKDPAPVIPVPTPDQEYRLAELREEIARLDARLAERSRDPGPGYPRWLEEAAAKGAETVNPSEGLVAHYPLDEEAGPAVLDAVTGKPAGRVKGGRAFREAGKQGGAVAFDGRRHVDLGKAGDFERDRGFSYGCWVRWNGGAGGMAAIARMDDGDAHRGWDLYLAGGQVAAHIIHRWPDNALKVTTNAKIQPGVWTHLFVTYDGSSKASGLKVYIDGKPQEVAVNVDGLQYTVRTRTGLRLGMRNPGSPYQGLIDEVRLYDRALSADEVAVLAGANPIGPILVTPPELRTPQQNEVLRAHYLNLHDPEYRDLSARRSKARAEVRGIEGSLATTLVMKEAPAPKDAFVLIRGEYDKKGEKVERKTPGFLPPMPAGVKPDRLGFARWLTDPGHPLTARVAVNRLWQQVFGVGLVKTSDDFGSQGEWPSHPELLDWLAVEFVSEGWDIKRLMRRVVTSATYRQSSRAAPGLYRRDPENRLLARGPRFRLDAEVLRDQALAVSGLLVPKMGGPSVKPPQPPGLWEAVGYTGSNTVRFEQDTGAKVFRRSVYTFWKRTSPPPQMTLFDAPSREACTMRRERTNTPLQALVLMNERQYVEAARHLAGRVLREAGKSPQERISFAFEHAAARPPGGEDLADLLLAYKTFRATYQADPEAAKKLIAVGDTAPDGSLDPVELASWTMVANVILNLDEVLNKE